MSNIIDITEKLKYKNKDARSLHNFKMFYEFDVDYNANILSKTNDKEERQTLQKLIESSMKELTQINLELSKRNQQLSKTY